MSEPLGLQVLPVVGLPEVQPGDDLAALIAAASTLVDGDVVVVTSKVVSKAEGRLLPAGDDREAVRQRAIDDEAVREVARRPQVRIVETRSGFVTANAGVDASNVAADVIALLPEDADASARRLRDGLRERCGVDVAVVVSDTTGRPWRHGLTDVAIGVAGLAAVVDHRGRHDPHGNVLDRTEIAVADEVAAAADLVKGKLAGVPVAVVRGLEFGDDGRGSRALLRAPEEDLFRLGTDEAIALGRAEVLRSADGVAVVAARRSVRSFAPDRVDPAALQRAVAAAVTAPAPHHTTPWRFVFVDTDEARSALLTAMRRAWVDDLLGDGTDEATIARRTSSSDALLGAAPYLVVPCLVTEGAHHYPDERRATAEREMFVVAIGAAVEAFLVALVAEGLGSCWVSSTMFCKPVVRRALGLPDEWDPMGAIAIGTPAHPATPRPDRDPRRFVVER